MASDVVSRNQQVPWDLCQTLQANHATALLQRVTPCNGNAVRATDRVAVSEVRRAQCGLSFTNACNYDVIYGTKPREKSQWTVSRDRFALLHELAPSLPWMFTESGSL